jgi:hypothetical protein
MYTISHLRMIIFNALMGLTVLSLITASSRSPGHPDHAPSSRSDHPSPSQASIPKLRDHREDLDQNLPADDDDIPLRYLRNPQWVTTRISKSRPSPLPLHVNRSRPRQQPRIGRRRENGSSRSTNSHGGNNDIMPSISPFPLAMSPFVPNTATDAGESSSEVDSDAAALEGPRLARRKAGHEADDEDALSESDCERGHNHNHDHEDYEDDEDVENGENDEDGDDTITANAPLLSRPPRSKALSRGGRPGHARARQSLMAKSNTGEPRWCRKCDGWKPDRCHHCRFCNRCVLKSTSVPACARTQPAALQTGLGMVSSTALMLVVDHHCVWLGTCVGYHNRTSTQFDSSPLNLPTLIAHRRSFGIHIGGSTLTLTRQAILALHHLRHPPRHLHQRRIGLPDLPLLCGLAGLRRGAIPSPAGPIAGLWQRHD